jgi:hypothetical protein
MEQYLRENPDLLPVSFHLASEYKPIVREHDPPNPDSSAGQEDGFAGSEGGPCDDDCDCLEGCNDEVCPLVMMDFDEVCVLQNRNWYMCSDLGPACEDDCDDDCDCLECRGSY